jgi:hypothetical protein
MIENIKRADYDWLPQNDWFRTFRDYLELDIKWLKCLIFDVTIRNVVKCIYFMTLYY